MQFGELLAAVRKAQANVMLFLEEKEQAALSQANGIKAHLEYRSAEMEKSKQELERMAAISNTVQFLEMRMTSHSTRTQHTSISGCRRRTARSPTPRPGSIPTRTSPAGSCTGGRCCPSRVCTCTGTILRWRSSGQAPMLA
ncbi:TRIM16 isoform 21 [Pongo abelii]|uniref:TRIM16 isoform 21 n=1 Tax=Pongo abelii TaxID=9601 RepID=A0A2J8TEW5_PONAB|nr:TRIM16 isoform 21 [Pongo abelii]